MHGIRNAVYFIMALSAFAGWASIELILWLLSHITIGIQ